MLFSPYQRTRSTRPHVHKRQRTNAKSHPWPKEAANGCNAVTIEGRVGRRGRTKRSNSYSDGVGCGRAFVLHAFLHVFLVPNDCVLAAPALSIRGGPLF